MEIDHYEALFDSTYLRWFDIADAEQVNVTIESVRRDTVTLRGGVEKLVPIVKFKGAKKELVLNKTNGDSIAELLGVKPSRWSGGRICLFVTNTKLKGKTVPCIRVKAVEP